MNASSSAGSPSFGGTTTGSGLFGFQGSWSSDSDEEEAWAGAGTRPVVLGGVGSITERVDPPLGTLGVAPVLPSVDPPYVCTCPMDLLGSVDDDISGLDIGDGGGRDASETLCATMTISGFGPSSPALRCRAASAAFA